MTRHCHTVGSAAAEMRVNVELRSGCARRRLAVLLSAIGGVGGNSGHSVWWALLLLPYLVGWSIDLWGPGAARWMSIAGVVIGTWYLAILGMLLRRTGNAAQHGIVPAIAVAVVGIATITACTVRLLVRVQPNER